MPYYESIFIVRQDVSAAQVETLATQFAEVVKANGGSVPKTEQWGLRSLTYRIRKNKKGHYVLFNLDAPPKAVAEMERQMRLNEDVLRYMTVKVEELETGPSVMLRRDDRDDRAPRGDRGDRGDRPMRAPRGDRAPRDDASED